MLENRLNRLRTANKLAFLLFLCCAAVPNPVWSHATGENYVWLNIQETHLEGRFEFRLDDLRNKLKIPVPADYQAAGPIIQATATQVQDYIKTRFAISANGRSFPIEFTETQLLKADGLGHFAQYHYRTPDSTVPERLTVNNRLFFENDPFHRSLLLVEYDRRRGKEYGEEFTALVFSPSNDLQVLDFTNIRGLLPIRDFIWQGMLHIWIGLDHILFLIALLLPAVLIRRENAWIPVDRFGMVLWNTVKIVTVFTVAHSITLALAALEIIQLPSRLVESVIALSIILVALNNIFPVFRASILIIIFVFGLFHGLGFASVMGELPFRMQDLVWVLVAFNVGVEIGQIAIVSAVVPLTFWLRKQAFYRHVVPVYGSALLATVAGYWLIERAFGLGQ